MKTLILTMLFSTVTFANESSFSTTCSFVELNSGVAKFINCSSNIGSEIKLIGSNNSPCKAQDALERLLVRSNPGDKVSMNVVGYYASTTGGMAFTWDVLDAAADNGVSIERIGKCNTTHIRFFRTK